MPHFKSFLVALVACTPAMAFAQTAAPTDRFAWDQAAPTLAAASAYTAEASIDTLAAVALTGKVCTGQTSPFACTAAIPAVTPGTHSVRLRVSELSGGVVLTSDYSIPYSFTMRTVPATPTNVRTVPVP